MAQQKEPIKKPKQKPDTKPDWGGKCEVCGASPIVPATLIWQRAPRPQSSRIWKPPSRLYTKSAITWSISYQMIGIRLCKQAFRELSETGKVENSKGATQMKQFFSAVLLGAAMLASSFAGAQVVTSTQGFSVSAPVALTSKGTTNGVSDYGLSYTMTTYRGDLPNGDSFAVGVSVYNLLRWTLRPSRMPSTRSRPATKFSEARTPWSRDARQWQ